MAYPFPGYLDRPADLAGNLISGFQAGAQVSEAQSRLQAEAERMGIESAERQRQMQMEQARQQQQMEMTKAYQDAQLGLRRTALDQTAQKIKLQTAQSANRLAAQQGYQKRYQELVGQGHQPQDAARTAMLENAGMFSSPAGMSQLAKQGGQYQWHAAGSLGAGSPGYLETPSGGAHVQGEQRTSQISPTAIFNHLSKRLDLLQEDPDVRKPINPKDPEKFQKAAQAKKDEYNALKKQIEDMMGSPSKQAAGQPRISGKPLPKAKKDLVTGETYQTRHGPATWDGTQFKRVTAPDFTEEADKDAQ